MCEAGLFFIRPETMQMSYNYDLLTNIATPISLFQNINKSKIAFYPRVIGFDCVVILRRDLHMSQVFDIYGNEILGLSKTDFYKYFSKIHNQLPFDFDENTQVKSFVFQGTITTTPLFNSIPINSSNYAKRHYISRDSDNFIIYKNQFGYISSVKEIRNDILIEENINAEEEKDITFLLNKQIKDCLSDSDLNYYLTDNEITKSCNIFCDRDNRRKRGDINEFVISDYLYAVLEDSKGVEVISDYYQLDIINKILDSTKITYLIDLTKDSEEDIDNQELLLSRSNDVINKLNNTSDYFVSGMTIKPLDQKMDINFTVYKPHYIHFYPTFVSPIANVRKVMKQLIFERNDLNKQVRSIKSMMGVNSQIEFRQRIIEEKTYSYLTSLHKYYNRTNFQYET